MKSAILQKNIFIAALIVLNCSNYSQSWQSIGPPGGRVNALAINPQNQSIVYAGTRDGSIFKSTDKGINTELISDEIDIGFVDQIAINPKNPNIIYSSRYRSVDGGTSWKKLDNGVGGNKYTFNPLNPDIIYATQYENILISRNGGDSWRVLFTLQHSTGQIEISPADTNIIYVNGDAAVYKSTNSGKDWWKVTTQLGEIVVLSLKVNPYNANTLFVGTKDEGIFKTNDGGITWDLILNSGWVNDIVIDPSEASIIYAVTGDYLYGYYGNVYKTSNGGRDWSTINLGLPIAKNRYLYAIIINPLNPEELYVGTYGWGVFKTINGGVDWTWTKLTITSVLSIHVDKDSSGHLYAGTLDEGVLITRDDGENWRALDFGNIQTVQHPFREFMFDPQNRMIAYATGGQYGLFKSIDEGNMWKLTSLQGNFDTYIWTVNVHPQRSEIIYVGQTGWLARDLYRSTDSGVTWQNMRITNSEASIEDIIFDPIDPSTIYIAAGEKGIFKTTDDGETWYTINNGLRISDEPLYSPVVSLAIRKDSTNILYAGQSAVGKDKGGVFLTKDSDIKWTSIDSGLELLNQNLSVRDIAVNNINQQMIYISLGFHGQSPEGGLFRTSNNGRTWERIFNDTYDAFSIAVSGNLAINTHNPQEIYLSSGYGIVKLLDSSITTGVSLNNSVDPKGYQLLQNYPNPFNQKTIITYVIPELTDVELKIYGVLGKEVRKIISAELQKGLYKANWDGKNNEGDDVASGIYFYHLVCNKTILAKKMILLR